MIIIYRLLFLPVFFLLSPYYFRRMLKRGGYFTSVKERFGLFPKLKKTEGIKRIWIQAVSVGEIQSLKPLIDKLISYYENSEKKCEIILTTTTSTGFLVAKKIFSSDKIFHIGFFPIDFYVFSFIAWNRLNPDLVFLMEGELWPEHLSMANKRNVPVVLINGRLSDRSFARYNLFKPIIKKILNQITLILASSEEDKLRFLKLGARELSVLNAGNLKLDKNFQNIDNETIHKLKTEVGFDEISKQLILLGASTWPGEEIFLINVFKECLAKNISVKLVLVPRHPERREEILTILKDNNLSFKLRSDKKSFESFKKLNLSANSQNEKSENFDDKFVYVVDTINELEMFIQISDVIFVGKSLPPNNGGQNPIESVAFEKPIVYGPNMTNFKSICNNLERISGAIKINNEQEGLEALINLLTDSNLRLKTGTSAKKWLNLNRGTSFRIIELINQFL